MDIKAENPPLRHLVAWERLILVNLIYTYPVNLHNWCRFIFLESVLLDISPTGMSRGGLAEATRSITLSRWFWWRGVWIPATHAHTLSDNGPLTRYVKLRIAHAPAMPGTFSTPSRVSDPDMHHGTCVTHVPWCMPGSLTNGFIWSRWRGKHCWHPRRMRNPQFYVSGKRPNVSCGGLQALPITHPSQWANIRSSNGSQLFNLFFSRECPLCLSAVFLPSGLWRNELRTSV